MKLFVDKVVVLGLEKNQEHIKKKFSKVFKQNKVDYFITKGVGTRQNDGQVDASYWSILNHNATDEISKDIFKNHIEIIKRAYEDQSIKNILILEDDAEFKNWDQKRWENVETFLKLYQEEWDIFYLGYCNWPYLWSYFIRPSILRLSSPLTAHSYILNRKGMYKILKTIEKNPQCRNMHIDKLYTKIPRFKKLGLFPMVCFQEKCPGLYLKACDMMGVRVLFSTYSICNQWISILIPIFIFFLFLYCILYNHVFKKMIKKKVI